MPKTYYDKTRKKAIRIINLDAYMEKHPDSNLIAVKVPSIKTLQKWGENGISRTPCKCRVEPDGHCPHGAPSWMLLLGVI